MLILYIEDEIEFRKQILEIPLNSHKFARDGSAHTLTKHSRIYYISFFCL